MLNTPPYIANILHLPPEEYAHSDFEFCDKILRYCGITTNAYQSGWSPEEKSIYMCVCVC